MQWDFFASDYYIKLDCINILSEMILPFYIFVLICFCIQRFLVSCLLMYFTSDGICRSSESFSWWNSTCLRRLSVMTQRLQQDSRISIFPRDHRKFSCIFSSRFYGNFFLKISENVSGFQFHFFTVLSFFFFFPKDTFTPVKGCGSENALRKWLQSDSSS